MANGAMIEGESSEWVDRAHAIQANTTFQNTEPQEKPEMLPNRACGVWQFRHTSDKNEKCEKFPKFLFCLWLRPRIPERLGRGLQLAHVDGARQNLGPPRAHKLKALADRPAEADHEEPHDHARGARVAVDRVNQHRVAGGERVVDEAADLAQRLALTTECQWSRMGCTCVFRHKEEDKKSTNKSKTE